MGHIFERNGHWSYRIDVGKTINGKRPRHTVSGFETKELAKQAMIQAEQQVQNGTYFTRRLQMKEIFQEWMEDTFTSVKAQENKHVIEVAVRYILPYFGEWKLEDVTEHALLAFWQFLSNRVPEAVTEKDVELAKTACLELMEYCVEKHYLSREDVPDYKKVMELSAQISFWTLKQTRAFLEAAETEREYPLYLLLITTGIDMNELFSLKWRMIDKEKRVLHLTETRNRQRTIALPKSTWKALENWRHLLTYEKEQADATYIPSTYLVIDEYGRNLIKDALQRTFERVSKMVNLPIITLEDIRHTHALFLLEKELTYEQVAQHLGHHNVQITKDLYREHVKSAFDCPVTVMDALF